MTVLALMNIYNDEEICFDDIVRSFADMGLRRMDLFTWWADVDSDL